MRTGIIGLISMSILTVILLTAGPVVSNEGDEKAVREAAAQFYKALNSMFAGDLEPMKELWSHAEDITYMCGRKGDILYCGCQAYFFLSKISKI
jgi:hypothetical protein